MSPTHTDLRSQGQHGQHAIYTSLYDRLTGASSSPWRHVDVEHRDDGFTSNEDSQPAWAEDCEEGPHDEKKKPKMRNRYLVRSREWTLKSRKSAVARTFTNLYTPEARSEFVLPVVTIFHEDD